MSNAHRQARMEAAASGEYAHMDNAAFDRRTKALEYLHAREVLATCPDAEWDQANRKEWCARAELYAAFESAGFDRALLKRLGAYL